MDKKKKIHLIIICVMAGLLLIAGIVAAVLLATREVIADAEYTYDDEYHSYCTYAHAEGIDIDGVLEEACWQNKKWFTNTYLSNTDTGLPVLDVTSYLDEYGMYIAAKVSDTNLVWDGQRNPEVNSNFEFYVVAKNAGEIRENDVVDYVIYNVDMAGDVCSEYSNVDRAVIVDGELNSGETKSATLEMFIPWQTMGVDPAKGIPTEFYLMPGYMAVFPGQEKTSVMKPVWYPYRYPTDYYVFNKDGYTNIDRDGAVVGDSKFGHAKTANWDISQEADGIIRSSTGTENHKIFFTKEYGKNFIVETTLIPIQDLENSGPKVGIYFQTPTDVYNAVMLDMRKSYLTEPKEGVCNFSTLRIAALDTNDSGWNMQYLDEYRCENPNAASKEGVKLTVIKYGSQYWIFLDGKFITTVDYYFMDTNVIPGFFSLGGDVIFKDYSCKTMDKDTLKEYLNERDIYLIDAKVASAGGEVSTSKFSVAKGGSYDIEVVSNSGYEVSSVLVNDKEYIGSIKKNGSGGTYTINNVKGNQEVKVLFQKCEGNKFTGQVKAGEQYLVSEITLKGVTNKALCYKTSSTGEKGFMLMVPAGTYEVTVQTEGYRNVVGKVTIKGDTSKVYTAIASMFAETVTVNEKKVESSMGVWDLEKEYLGKVSTSYVKGGKMAPLYFSETAKDFVVEATVDYTTVFQSGVEYQPDLMGGFVFNNGSNSGWIVANKSGVTYTDWKRTRGLIDYDVMTYPDKKTGHIAVSKTGDTVYLYLDKRLVSTMKWSEIAPDIDSKSEVAIGLYMVANKNADIQFSDYSLKTGAKSVKSYMASVEKNLVRSVPVSGSSIFSNYVIVNDKKVASKLDNWNLTDVANGNVTTSYAMKGKEKPLYLTKYGSSILVEATIEYTTVFKEGVDYQKDLMGGFMLSDGTNRGWVVANNNGLTYTGWAKERGLVDDYILTYPEPIPVKMTMAVKDGYVHVYFDDEYVWKQKLSVVVPNADEKSDLAVALLMISDKTADIKFGDVSIVTNATTVQNYIDGHPKKSASLPTAALTMEQKNYAGLLSQGIVANNSLEAVGKVSPGNNTTLFIGDSFFDVRRYWTDFYEDYAGKDVFTAGISSSRADQWRDILVEQICASFGNKSPKNIVIHIGTNDIHDGAYSTNRVKNNLTGLFTMLHEKYPQAKIYYFGITHRAGQPVYKDNVVNSYITEWCKAKDYITYIDTPSLITTDMLRDGVHPKLEYYSIFMDELQKAGCVILNK